MITYLLQSSILISVCLLFYKLLLQRQTFFQANRWILIGCLIIAFLIPLVKIPSQLKWNIINNQEQVKIGTDPNNVSNSTLGKTNFSKNMVPSFTKNTNHDWRRSITNLYGKGILYIYVTGVIIFGLSLLVQILTLVYRAVTNNILRDGKYRIIEIKANANPCSFFIWIFINPERYDWNIYNQILLHEKIHIDHVHIVDILLAELLIIAQWFNPFAWAYRKAIENNLEYITDKTMIQDRGIEKTSYQMNLLKVAVPSMPLGVTTNYNQSLLKSRIIMMNIKRSSISSLWKYLFIAPLLVLMMSLLNEPNANSKGMTAHIKPEVMINSTPNPEFSVLISGTWTMEMPQHGLGKIYLNSKSDGVNWNSAREVTEEEFSPALASKSEVLKWNREVGTMTLNGKWDGSKGHGAYDFMPSIDIRKTLRKHGISEITDGDLFFLFLSDINTSYLNYLEQQGFNPISGQELVQLGIHDFSMSKMQSFLRMTGDANWGHLSVNKLIALKNMNADPTYYIMLQRMGYKGFSFDDFVAARTQGVDSIFITKQEASHSNIKLTLQDLIRLKMSVGKHDVSNQPLSTMKDTSFARYLAKLGYSELSTEKVKAAVNMQMDAAYITSLREIGYSDIDFDHLLAMKTMGIDKNYIQNMKLEGYSNIPVEKLLQLKTIGIQSSFIEAFRQVGFTDIPLSVVLTLKDCGINAEYIKTMQKKGCWYSNINDYIALGKQEKPHN